MKSMGRLPPFSPVLNRLMGELACEGVSFAKLAELIERDTVLASNVLRVVNSPLYGLRATVNSVRHAVAVLGLAQLRNIVLSLSVSQLWSRVRTPAGWSMPHFNRHSVAVAMLADLLALEMRTEYAEGAFTAGLLHDVGKLLIAITFPDEFREIDRLAGADWRQETGHEGAILGLIHADLSAAALASWNLPEPIIDAAANHHAMTAIDATSLSGVLRAADRIANELGYGCRTSVTAGGDPAAALADIGKPDRAPAFLADFDRAFQAMGGFC